MVVLVTVPVNRADEVKPGGNRVDAPTLGMDVMVVRAMVVVSAPATGVISTKTRVVAFSPLVRSTAATKITLVPDVFNCALD